MQKHTFPLQDFFLHIDLFPLEILGENLFPWHILHALTSYMDRLPLGKIEIDLHPSVYVEKKEKISIAKGASIEPGSFIKGPCIIGPHAQVRSGSYIRPYTIIGAECLVGHGSEIKHSILLKGAKAAHFNYVGDSIIGENANLGAGVKLANVRLDGKEIRVEWKKNHYETGLKKMGAIEGNISDFNIMDLNLLKEIAEEKSYDS